MADRSPFPFLLLVSDRLLDSVLLALSSARPFSRSRLGSDNRLWLAFLRRLCLGSICHALILLPTEDVLIASCTARISYAHESRYLSARIWPGSLMNFFDEEVVLLLLLVLFTLSACVEM